MDIGDIIIRDGIHWAILERVYEPRPGWRVGRILDGQPTSIDVYGSQTVVASPEFSPGQKIRIGDQMGTVVADHGATICAAT